MNNCPNCRLLISDKSYSFCPYCQQTIRKLEIVCPERVYAGITFLVTCFARGTESIIIESILLNGEPLDMEAVSIAPGNSWSLEMRVESPGIHTVTVKTAAGEQSYTLRSVNLGYFSLNWQNNQVLELGDGEINRKIYVSRELSSNSILPSRNTQSWLDIRRISILAENLEYACVQTPSGFQIPDDFFDLFELQEKSNAEIKVVTSENYILQIRNLLFVYSPQLPDIKLSSSDYVNDAPLSSYNKVISFTLSYTHVDEDMERPLNQIQLRFLSDFVTDQNIDKFFDNEQRARFDVEIDTGRFSQAGESTDITSRIEFQALYKLADSEEELCRYFDIPFVFRRQTRERVTGDINKVIAIDFGTSNTVMSYVDSAGESILIQEPSVLKFHNFTATSPHAITYGEDVGDNDQPLTFATNFKPRLNRDEELYYFDRQIPRNTQAFKPSSLTKLYLENLLDRLLWNVNPKPGRALISYPADFPDRTRHLVHEIVGDLVGLTSGLNATLTEPENIALYFALEPDSTIKKRIDEKGSTTICVFDCGGGTTDISIVRVSQEEQVSFDILATWGTDDFSGNYLTYMIGKSIDGQSDWFPQNFSMLYTANNEELKEYFKYMQNYEAIKINSLGEYSEQIQYQDLEESIRQEIRSLFNLIAENILYKLFMSGALDKTDTDFFILAGNSCRLSLFNEVAQEIFGDSEIIWKPEDGKKAVALGALKAHELAGSLNIKGTSRSKYEYLYRHGLNMVTLFEPLLDMQEGGSIISNRVNPRSIPILGRHMVDDVQTQPVIVFTLPPPPEINEGFKYQFKLRFVNNTISYAWVSNNGDQTEETEFQAIHTET